MIVTNKKGLKTACSILSRGSTPSKLQHTESRPISVFSLSHYFNNCSYAGKMQPPGRQKMGRDLSTYPRHPKARKTPPSFPSSSLRRADTRYIIVPVIVLTLPKLVQEGVAGRNQVVELSGTEGWTRTSTYWRGCRPRGPPAKPPNRIAYFSPRLYPANRFRPLSWNGPKKTSWRTLGNSRAGGKAAGWIAAQRRRVLFWKLFRLQEAGMSWQLFLIPSIRCMHFHSRHRKDRQYNTEQAGKENQKSSSFLCAAFFNLPHVWGYNTIVFSGPCAVTIDWAETSRSWKWRLEWDLIVLQYYLLPADTVILEFLHPNVSSDVRQCWISLQSKSV
jgi:hypothetical protein